MKNETGKLTLCLRDFFHKRLECEKEASPNTIDSYAFTISKFCTVLHESGRWTSEIDDISDKNVLDFIESIQGNSRGATEPATIILPS